MRVMRRSLTAGPAAVEKCGHDNGSLRASQFLAGAFFLSLTSDFRRVVSRAKG